MKKNLKSISETAIIKKAFDASVGQTVMNTSLQIDGKDLGTDMQWFLDNLEQFDGKSAVWEVILGLKDDDSISIFKGSIEGTIIAPQRDIAKETTFEKCFIPQGQEKSVYELELPSVFPTIEKNSYSAKKIAVANVVSKEPISVHLISEVTK